MFDQMTPESIKANIFKELQASGVAVDTCEGSYTDALIGPAALEIWKIYMAFQALLPIVYPDETSGIYIDKRCAYYGIVRKAGTAAQVLLTVSGRRGAVIPKGSVFLSADGMRFLSDQEEMFEEEQLQISATAAEVGMKYNVGAKEIVRQLTSLAGVTAVSNEAAAFGGTEPESDVALLARLYTRLREAATSGNANHYKQWALEVSGVGAVKVIPLEQGPGTVGVLLASEEMGPVDEAVVAACAKYIEERRPIGAAVTVRAAQGCPISVSATVRIDASTTKEAVQAAFTKGLAEYLRSISFVQYELPFTKVGYLLSGVDGVLDYSGLTVNGQSGNVVLHVDQVPQVGEVLIDAIA